MKKKTLVWAYLIVLSLGTILSLYIPKNEVAAKDAIVIPGQAIRLRILANSDLNSDQALKRQVRDQVNAKISVWVKDLTSIKEARKVIQSKLPEIKKTAMEVVKQHGSNQTVKVKLGKVQFPTKLYGQFLYPAGNYEAVLITLGEGKGANWWCVLFPPLCFLDFSNGVAVSKGFDEQKDANAKNSAGAELKKVEDGTQSKQKSGQDLVAAKDESKKPQVKQEQMVTGSSDAEKETNSSTADSGLTSSKSDQSVSSAQPSNELDSNQAVSQSEQKEQQDSKDSKPAKHKEKAPVYTSEDEQPIKVKFFAVELWKKLF